MQCGSDGQLYMEKEELELENKPEGGEKEKQAPEQKPAMNEIANTHFSELCNTKCNTK